MLEQRDGWARCAVFLAAGALGFRGLAGGAVDPVLEGVAEREAQIGLRGVESASLPFEESHGMGGVAERGALSAALRARDESGDGEALSERGVTPRGVELVGVPVEAQETRAELMTLS